MKTIFEPVKIQSTAAARGPIPAVVQNQGSVHLDALRGIAAVLVFVNHSRALYFSSAVDPSAKAALQFPHAGLSGSGGELTLASEAVVIFFVLSGFLVGGSVLRGIQSSRWSWTDYLIKRLSRLCVVLVPAVILGVSLDHAGISLFGPTSVYGNPAGLGISVTGKLAEHLTPSIVIGNLFFVQGILCPSVGTNKSLWSLANEFWYYVVFPFLAFALFSRLRFSLRVAAAGIACLLLAFIGPTISLLFPVWLAGALIALVPRWRESKHMNLVVPVFAVLLLIVMLSVRFAHVQGLVGYYIVGMASCIAVYVLIQDTRPSKGGIYRKSATFFSQISYSLYLFHLPLAVFICGLLNTPWHHWAKTPRNFAEWAGAEAAILVITYALWRLFEANTGRIRSRIFGAA